MSAIATTLPAKLPTQLFHAGHYWNELQYMAEPGVSLDHILDPRFWIHVQPLLKPRDVITVLAKDFTFEARLRVTNAEKGNLRLRLIGYVGDELVDEKPAAAATDESPYDVNFVPQHKWRVVEKATKEVVAKDLGTREEAEAARDTLIAARKAA